MGIFSYDCSINSKVSGKAIWQLAINADAAMDTNEAKRKLIKLARLLAGIDFDSRFMAISIDEIH